MSMDLLRWLAPATERQKQAASRDRIAHLEQCNRRLADHADSLEAERVKFKRERDAAIAERDATAKLLEETTASLIDAKRRNGHLLDEFDRLAGMFRKKIDDLTAAEQLLDEAGGEIELLLELLGSACEERDEHQAKLIDIERTLVR